MEHEEQLAYIRQLFATFISHVDTRIIVADGIDIIIDDRVVITHSWRPEEWFFDLGLIKDIPGTREYPPDQDIEDKGTYKRFQDAAREALLLWINIMAQQFDQNWTIDKIEKYEDPNKCQFCGGPNH